MALLFFLFKKVNDLLPTLIFLKKMTGDMLSTSSDSDWKIRAMSFFTQKNSFSNQKLPTNILRTSRNQFINLISSKNSPNYKIKSNKISHPGPIFGFLGLK
jgi:hypothetical protein